jgi:hypothetical protein
MSNPKASPPAPFEVCDGDEAMRRMKALARRALSVPKDSLPMPSKRKGKAAPKNDKP